MIRSLTNKVLTLNSKSLLLKHAAGVTSQTSRASSNYIEEQKKKGRPLSPHVTGYRFPLVAISSVTNRITGVALVGGLYGIGALALVGVDIPSLFSLLGSSSIAPLAKFTVAYPLVYHYLGAARHTYWDFNPETLENKDVELTSYGIFGATGALSILAAIL